MGRHCSETENQLDVIKIGDIIILTQIMGRGYYYIDPDHGSDGIQMVLVARYTYCEWS